MQRVQLAVAEKDQSFPRPSRRCCLVEKMPLECRDNFRRMDAEAIPLFPYNRREDEMTCHKSWKTICLDLIFPPRCLLCEQSLVLEEIAPLCRACRSNIDYLRSPFCRCCGEKVAGGTDRRHLCGRCLSQPPPYLRARACIRYDQPVSGLLHRLKYGGDTSVLPGLEYIIRNADSLDIPQPDLVVPVPLHPQRLKERGLNQAVLLARLFFPERLRQIRPDVLVRLRNTPAQTSLDGPARRKNLRGAFAVAEKALVQGRTVCLVDDVYTTGTTVSECSRPLLRAGAREVVVLTLARVTPAL